MKKSVILLILIILTFALFCPTAFGAEEEYYKITDSSAVLLLDDENTNNALFTIKSGCYVKRLGEKNDYYLVEYHGASGRIKKSQVEQTPYSNLSQYYHNEIRIFITHNNPSICVIIILILTE